MLCHRLGCFPLGIRGTTKGPMFMRGKVDDRDSHEQMMISVFSDMYGCMRA